MKQKRMLPLLGTILLCAFLIIPVSSVAQGKADFSGEWALNESESNIGEGRFGSSPKIVVKQGTSEITIDRTRTGRDGQEMVRSQTLTLDGKDNKDEGENRSSTSVVTWSGDGASLTIKTDTKMDRQGEVFEMSSKEVWTLGSDKNVLKIESTSSSSMGDRTANLVYNKK